jgi:hypothetical protein
MRITLDEFKEKRYQRQAEEAQSMFEQSMGYQMMHNNFVQNN